VQVIEHQKTNIPQTIAVDENKNELIYSKPFLRSLNRIMVKCPGVKCVWILRLQNPFPCVNASIEVEK